MSPKSIYLVLHNLRSAENVGAIFRTADAAGVSKIYLSGYTPRPKDQFGRINGKIAKSALGAEITVPWVGAKNVSRLIGELKEAKVKVVAVEQDKKATDYKKFKLSRPTAFIFGNEVSGLTPSVLGHCDRIIEIPMRGKKESLNVSVAVGVVLFNH